MGLGLQATLPVHMGRVGEGFKGSSSHPFPCSALSALSPVGERRGGVWGPIHFVFKAGFSLPAL